MRDCLTTAKECAACWKVKPAECFGVRRDRGGALHSYCKRCRADMERERRAAHIARGLKYDARWKAR